MFAVMKLFRSELKKKLIFNEIAPEKNRQKIVNKFDLILKLS